MFNGQQQHSQGFQTKFNQLQNLDFVKYEQVLKQHSSLTYL